MPEKTFPSTAAELKSLAQPGDGNASRVDPFAYPGVGVPGNASQIRTFALPASGTFSDIGATSNTIGTGTGGGRKPPVERPVSAFA